MDIPLPAVSEILIIDDTENDGYRFSNAIRCMGYSSRTAQSVAQGFYFAFSNQPCLILAALEIGKIGGPSLCRLFQTDQRTCDIPIVVLARSNNVESRIDCLSAGAIDVLNKDIDPRELHARIRAYLRLQKTPKIQSIKDVKPKSPTVNLDKAIVKAAIEYIENNLDCLPSVHVIAREVGTYRERLSVLFQEEFGSTVFAFARRRRIERSQVLLCNTDMKIQDIAAAVGFENPGSFATAFKELYGCSPKEHRASNFNYKNAANII